MSTSPPKSAQPKKPGQPLARPSYVRAPNTITPAQQQALAWLHTTRFLTTAAQLHQLPPHDAPEIAFVGRSNAGKSTSINTLTQQRQLAYASKTPGRTQHINLFAVGRQGGTDVVLADLPGYGYAAVPKADKERWQRVMANYLVSRANLIGVVMLIDPRHGLTELDEILLEVIRPRVEEGLKFLVLLTKSDKLTRVEAKKALDIARLQAGGGQVQLFSGLKKQGVGEAALVLQSWIGTPAQRGTAPQADELAGDPASHERDRSAHRSAHPSAHPPADEEPPALD
jgi:GTP-binding protein